MPYTPTPSKTNISIGRPLDPSMNVQRIVVIDKKKMHTQMPIMHVP